MNQLLPLRWPVEPEWQRPEALALLEGTPLNCILVNEASQPLTEAATKRGIQILRTEPADVVLLKDGVWPGVQRGSGGGTDAGPTGPPWVDANGWAIQLAQAQNPGKTVWVDGKLPEDRILRPDHYALAVADAEAYGSRRVIGLDPALRKALLSGEGQAKETWSAVANALRFFARRREAMTGMEPLTRLGVVSSFTGADEFLSTEVLNLAARRHLPYRILTDAAGAKLDGLAAVLWVREKAPEGAEKRALDEYVQSGGTLILPASAGHVIDGAAGTKAHETGYRLARAGKGSIAVANQPWSDPYVVATDAHRVMTRRHDPFRLWNAAACNAHVLTRGPRTVAHVLNFTARAAGHPISLWVARPGRSAISWDVFGRTAKLAVVEKNGGIEVSLPSVASYVQVEFTEQA